MSNSNRISLEQSLKAYQVMHSPSKFSWKQHWAKEKFSSADMLNCSDEEQEQFKKRLKECTITMCGGIKALSGDVVTLDKVVSTITSHGAGYIDKDLETIVGVQTDAPLKR